MKYIALILCLFCFSLSTHSQDMTAEEDSVAYDLGTCLARADAAAAEKDYESAIHWELEVISILEETEGDESRQYALALNRLATYLAETGKYGVAFSFASYASYLLDTHNYKEEPDYSSTMENARKIEDRTLAYWDECQARADSAAQAGNNLEAARWEQIVGDLVHEMLGNSTYYAISLNQQSIYYSTEGDYATAIDLVKQAMEVWESVAETDDPNYQTMTENLAYYESIWQIADLQAKADSALAAGDYHTAIRWRAEAVDLYKARGDTLAFAYRRTMNELALHHGTVGEYAEAIRLLKEVIRLHREANDGEDRNYATYLENMAEYKCLQGDYATAIDLGRKALEVRKNVQGDRNTDYAQSLTKLSKYYFALGDIRTAVQLCSQALQVQADTPEGKQTHAYAAALNELARYNAALGKLSEAIRLGEEALDVTRACKEENSPSYCNMLGNLAQYHSNAGHYREAIRLGEEVLALRRELLGTEHPDYARSLNNIATSYTALGDYKRAIQLTREAQDIWRKTIGENHPDYISTLNNLANNYNDMGDYQEAIRLETEALANLEKSLGKNHPEYALLLNNLATHNLALGNYQEGIEQLTQALRIQRAAFGEQHPDIAQTLQNLGYVYNSLGNYEASLRVNTQAAEIFNETMGERYVGYAVVLNNISLTSFLAGDNQKAWEYGNRALQIFKEELGDYNPDLAVIYNNLGLISERMGADSIAFDLLNQSIEIQKKNGREKHKDYATTLGILASHLFRHGKPKEAIALMKTSLQIIADAVGKQHPDYISNLIVLASNEATLRLPETTAVCTEVTQRLTENICETFGYLTNHERALFWQQNRYWFSPFIHQAAYTFPSDSLSANAYNGLLLSKGLLLNSEIELSTLLAESGDAEVESLYNDLKSLRFQLNKLYEQPVAERALSTDSLEQEAQRLERALVQRSKVYGDFTRNLAIDWQQVQQRLGERDVAVEFASFATGQDSVMYAAYCLRRGDRAPRMMPLFEEKQLKAIGATHYYDRPDVARLVWQPLAEELKDADRVYFAPDGELYNIAIESVPHWADSLLVSDHYRFYRLSSTRQLALTRDEQSADEAALYGGLRYDTDVATMVNDSRRHPATTRTADFALFNLADSLNLRAGLQDLPATLTEAEEIETHLRNAGTHATLYTDTVGTETSFKALSGRRTRLMHIATHGFYWTEREAQAIGDRLAFLNTAGQTARYVEDKALTRSGLFFAGVNHALEGEPLPANVDDGILTAREISTLDLRGLDLVVLSACQTGLGEITGDGVFGLQRGFKKAGAKTLLMSLWKVDDQATQLLMTRFYANLVGGRSKAEALREAQQYVREYIVEQKVTPPDGRRPLSAQARQQAQQQQAGVAETQRVRPYHSPRFWAAFILLDALD